MRSSRGFTVYTLALALFLTPATTVWSQQKGESEREVLARVAAELELLEQLVDRAEARADDGARVYVSYEALRRDLRAVRDGLHTYIDGPRLQPRTFEPLSTDYVRLQQDGE